MDKWWNRAGVIGTWIAAALAAVAVWEAWPKSDGTVQGAPPMSSWALPAALISAIVVAGVLHVVAAVIGRGKQENPSSKTHDIAQANHDVCQRTIDNLESRIRTQEEVIEKERSWSKALTKELSEAKEGLRGKVQQFKDEHRRCQDLVEQKQLADKALAQSTADLVAVRKQIDDAAWLDQIAKTEMVAIDKTVVISSGGLLRKDFNGSAPYMNFNFYVHNCSVFAISLDSVDGFIKCVTAPIGKRLEVVDDQRSTIVSNECPHGSTRSLVVRVWLLQDDLKIMAACSDLYFKFDELRIKVKGGKNWPDVTSQKVTIDWVMDTNGNAKPWRS